MKTFIKLTLESIGLFAVTYIPYVALWVLSGQKPMFNIFDTSFVVTWIIGAFIIIFVTRLTIFKYDRD